MLLLPIPDSLGALSVMASNPSPSRVAPLPTPDSLKTSTKVTQPIEHCYQ
ncbi:MULTISPECIES: hypothetical protein [unclassified Moorena]|nr:MULTISPECIES: hypothetical protein [unclassified Moorena]NEQ12967.1 hypothetical protein [Moorena sp. SIO3E2]NER91816.1 hypothetical protein [Moorena sp. SIO3A2]